jgi:hypothetical protein
MIPAMDGEADVVSVAWYVVADSDGKILVQFQ